MNKAEASENTANSQHPERVRTMADKGDPEAGVEDCYGTDAEKYPDGCPHECCFLRECSCCAREDVLS